MAYINLASAKSTSSRYVGGNGFKGADFSSAPAFVALDRFSDVKNMYKDYKNGLGACVETFPGYRVIKELGGKIHSMCLLNVSNGSEFAKMYLGVDTKGQYLIVHAGSSLYYIDSGNSTSLVAPMGYGTMEVEDNDSVMFAANDNVYLLCGSRNIYKISPASWYDMYLEFGDLSEAVLTGNEIFFVKRLGNCYTPITYIDGKPYEQKNMLSAGFIEKYNVDQSKVVNGDSFTIYLHERVTNLHAIKINDKLEWGQYEDGSWISSKSYEFDITYEDDGGYQYISAVTITGTFNAGDVITVKGVSEDPKFTAYDGHPSFSAANPSYSGTAYEAIAGCTIMASFDDRIFLAGNPALPNTVFYSSRDLTGRNNPEYFGVLNYLTIGTSNAGVTAMISMASSLAVLKSESMQDASIYYLTGVNTGEDLLPRIYTVTEGLPGVGCLGAACNFLDDVVFVSRNGIMGIDKQAVNLERAVGNRSSLVNGRMLLENMANTIMVEWQGYLCVIFRDNGHMYMADSRQITGGEYEWYFIDSLGSWRGDYPRYTYPDGTELSKDEAALVAFDGNNARYYLTSDGTVVEPDGSRVGGTFCPARVAYSTGDLLIFGTDEGTLLCVNTDKRGVPSTFEAADKGFFNADDYAAECGNIIRPEWYSFAGHRYESFIQTAYDDGGIPNLAKTTETRSTVADMKTMPGSRFCFAVYASEQNWLQLDSSANHIPDFSIFNLDAVSFSQDYHTIITLRERTRRWSRKMYRVYSAGFCEPFGVYRISYRYTVAGRIKQ